MHDDIIVSCLNVQIPNKNEPKVKLNLVFQKWQRHFSDYWSQGYIHPTSLFLMSDDNLSENNTSCIPVV